MVKLVIRLRGFPNDFHTKNIIVDPATDTPRVSFNDILGAIPNPQVYVNMFLAPFLAEELEGYSAEVLRGFAEGAGERGRQLLCRLRPLFTLNPIVLMGQQDRILPELDAALQPYRA
ncbi:MAG TPA: hypothetical protein VMT55_06420 [Candidatus Sulfotelmatobacter sp.]|nr:hypothetical protein [Candidatus Sulfotelmatobacter sp.]